MKWRDYKSNIGMFLVGIHVLAYMRILVIFLDNPPYHAEVLLIKSLDLTGPVGIILIMVFLDIARPENGVYINLTFIFFSALVNTLVIYFVGCLLTKLLRLLRKLAGYLLSIVLRLLRKAVSRK